MTLLKTERHTIILNEEVILTCRTLEEPIHIFKWLYYFIIHKQEVTLNGVESIFIFFLFLAYHQFPRTSQNHNYPL